MQYSIWRNGGNVHICHTTLLCGSPSTTPMIMSRQWAVHVYFNCQRHVPYPSHTLHSPTNRRLCFARCRIAKTDLIIPSSVCVLCAIVPMLCGHNQHFPDKCQVSEIPLLPDFLRSTVIFMGRSNEERGAAIWQVILSCDRAIEYAVLLFHIPNLS